ncbi:MAG: GIY-YIG nuclease family protein [Candidatus Acidiferrales bacterium]
MPFYVYILKSSSTGRYYVGHSSHLERRLAEHNRGHTVSIRGRGPWEIVHTEKFATKLEAARRERQIKAMKSCVWIEELIRTQGG